MPSQCKQDGCKTWPSFNYPGQNAMYCASHCRKGMIDVSSRVCLHEGCRKNPSFNYNGIKKGLYCSGHKLEGMVDVKTRKCQHEGCTVFPTFNTNGERPGIYCAKHKEPGMSDVRKKVSNPCQFEGCKEKPTFNFPGMKGSRYCAEHKIDGMECNLKTCKNPACERPPTYNYEDTDTPIYCSYHRLEGMIYLSNRRRNACEEPGCLSFPRWDFKSAVETKAKAKRKGKFCEDHKKEGMELVVDICAKKYCYKTPLYNFPDQTQPLYCTHHRLENMVQPLKVAAKMERKRSVSGEANFSEASDFASPTELNSTGECTVPTTTNCRGSSRKRRECEGEGCVRQPSFNFPGESKRRFCAFHRQPGMIAVSRKKRDSSPRPQAPVNTTIFSIGAPPLPVNWSAPHTAAATTDLPIPHSTSMKRNIGEVSGFADTSISFRVRTDEMLETSRSGPPEVIVGVLCTESHVPVEDSQHIGSTFLDNSKTSKDSTIQKPSWLHCHAVPAMEPLSIPPDSVSV